MQAHTIQYQNSHKVFLMFFIGLIFVLLSCFYAHLRTFQTETIIYPSLTEKSVESLEIASWTQDTIPWKGW